MSAVAHIDEYKTGRFFSDEFRGSLSWNGRENNVLLRHRGNQLAEDREIPVFTDVAMALGTDGIRDARGVAILDIDNDGDLDIAVNHHPGDDGTTTVPALLYRNNIGQEQNWLAVRLTGTTVNRDAVGAEIRLEAGSLRAMRHVQAGSAYAGQQTQKLYFGLGAEETVDVLRITWPNGDRQVLRNLPTRRFLHVIQGQEVQFKEPVYPAPRMGGQ